MAIKISAKHDSLPSGAEIELSQICVVPNGGSVELDSEQEARFHERFPDGITEGVFSVKELKKKARSAEPDPEVEDDYDAADETEVEVDTNTNDEVEGGDGN